MALVSFNEDICERLFDDLQNIHRKASNAQPRRDMSLKDFEAHVEAHRIACDSAFYQFMDLVTDPRYSNAWVVKENDKLKSEILDLKELISYYLEAIAKKDQENDRLLSKLRARNERIEKLEADLVNCIRERKQFSNLSNTCVVSTNIRKPGKKKSRKK